MDLISTYDELVLDEFNVKDELLENLKKSIDGDSLCAREVIFAILNQVKLSKQDMQLFSSINKLTLACGMIDDSHYYDGRKIMSFFKRCKNVTLEGNVRSIDLLKQFKYIRDLSKQANSDLSNIVRDLSYYGNLKSVKNFSIHSDYISYFCDSDLNCMCDLETLEFSCHNVGLELAFDDLSNLQKLKKICMDVDYLLQEEINIQIPIWKQDRKDLEVIFVE